MKEIGIKDIEELYSDVPSKFRLKKKLKLPNSMSEQEVESYVEKLLSKNKTLRDMPIFLGVGQLLNV